MKKLIYSFMGNSVEMPWNESNEEIAKAEADNGEYTVEDDGKTVAAALPSESERLAALEAAMLELMGVTANG